MNETEEENKTFFELVFFDGHKGFSNRDFREMRPEARFTNYPSEVEVYKDIVRSHKTEFRKIYRLILAAMFEDYTDEKRFKKRSHDEQAQIIYDFSISCWQEGTTQTDVFTLLNVKDKTYEILDRYGFIDENREIWIYDFITLPDESDSETDSDTSFDEERDEDLTILDPFD